MEEKWEIHIFGKIPFRGHKSKCMRPENKHQNENSDYRKLSIGIKAGQRQQYGVRVWWVAILPRCGGVFPRRAPVPPEVFYRNPAGIPNVWYERYHIFIINMHSDTQTNNPKEIAHKQFTPVVSLTVHGEMNFNVHVNRSDKAGRVLSKLNKVHLSKILHLVTILGIVLPEWYRITPAIGPMHRTMVGGSSSKLQVIVE
jgi:hypothetical protein